MYSGSMIRASRGISNQIGRVCTNGISSRCFGARSLHKSAQLMNDNDSKPLPSTPEMKSEKWQFGESIEQNPEDKGIASKVISMTNLLQDQREPPLDIDDMFSKKFKPFDSYDPFDFSINQLDIDNRLKKYPVNAKSKDPFERSGINPLDLYTMPFILSRFLTSTGQILNRDITGCNSKNQKKLAIAIKRARACGLLSSVHKDSSFLPSRNL